MIRIFRFKKNDLNPSGGKQIEFSISDVKDFFKFTSNEVTIDFKFQSLMPNNPLNGYKFKSTFKLSPSRGDYKCYGNLDQTPNLKDFFLEKLHLTIEENLKDSYALKKVSDTSYIITYIPSEIQFSEVANFLYTQNTSTSKESEGSKEEMSIDFKALSLSKNSNIPTLAAMRTKPFLLLAGISGTGKSRIVRKMAQATVPKDLQVAFDGKNRNTEDFKEERWTLQRPANFELIQVKPNWHNSMDVVGYLSNIPAPHYVFTPFINFIVRAMCHPEVPFFLCLDEMNLAPVEEYFAEFLSAIESRAMDKDGNYITDPIIPPFHNFGEVKDQAGNKTNVGEDMLNIVQEIIKQEGVSDERRGKVRNHLEKRGVTLPKNLIIVGTVNMDETTFSFSRKVLDRAISMEMNQVDYSSFLFDTTDDDIKAIAKAYDVDADSTGDDNQLNRLLVDRHIEAKEVVADLGGAYEDSDARFVIDYLETINKLLDGTPFKLGYRAANEALIYLKSSMDFGNDDRAEAMDKFTLMKILSRIEGDESKLRLTREDSDRLEGCGVDYDRISQERGGATLLSAMKEIILNKLRVKETANLQDNIEDAEIEGEETAAPLKKEESAPLESIKKLDSMIAQLDRDHFVTYWS